MTASWREWFRQRYAKALYGVGSFLFDGLVVAVTLQTTDASQIWPYVLSFVLVVGLTYVEFLGLRRFWPPKSSH